MRILFNKNEIKNKIQHYKMAILQLKDRARKMTASSNEDKVDEAGLESFPASDPPGHQSKSQEDRELH